MITVDKVKDAALKTMEAAGEKLESFVESRKLVLGLAAGNFVASSCCLVIAIEAGTKPVPNDKISTLALLVSGITGIASGANWQNYNQARDSEKA